MDQAGFCPAWNQRQNADLFYIPREMVKLWVPLEYRFRGSTLNLADTITGRHAKNKLYSTLFLCCLFCVFLSFLNIPPFFRFSFFVCFCFLNMAPCFSFFCVFFFLIYNILLSIFLFLCFFIYKIYYPVFYFAFFCRFFLLLNIPPARAKECKVVAKLLCKDICCL